VIWSAETYKIYEIKREDFHTTHETFMKLVHPGDVAKVDLAFKESYSKKTLQTLQHRIITPSGIIKYIEECWKIVYDEKGKPVRAVGTSQDITERAIFQEQREFEKRDKEALINTTDDLIWSLSSDFKLIAANNAFIKGMKAVAGVILKPGDDLLMKNVFTEEYLVFWKACYNKVLAGNSVQQEVYYPPITNSKESWGDISFKPIYKNNEVVGIACYSRDITERKLSEEMLRLSEAHLAEAQKLAKMGSWDFDIASGKLTWSQNLYDVFGTDKKTFHETHESFIHHVHEDDRYFVLKTNSQTMESGNPFSIEYNITTKKGENKVIQEHGYGVKDEKGKVIRLFGTAQDITESKKAEAALKEAFEEKNTVLESIDDGFFALDKNSLVTYWNSKAESLLNVKKEDVLGKNLFDMLTTPDSLVFYNNYQTAINENTTIHFEAFSKRSDKWFTVGAYPSDHGLSVYFKDVTENKLAEQNIINSEEKRRLIMNAALDAIICIDINGDITFWNPQAENIFGWTENEVLGKNFSGIIIPQEYRQAHKNEMDQYIKTGKGPVLNVLLKLSAMRRDGTSFPVELSILPIRQGDEEFFCAFIRDITENIKAENTIREALDEKSTILESIADAFFAVDKNWKVTYWNKHAEKVLQTPRNKILGSNLWNVFSTSIGSLSYKKYHEAIETRQVIQFQDYYPELNMWYDISAYPSANGLSVYFKDITERKVSEIMMNELNEDLKQQAKKLAISNAELEQFAYVTSHDLQEPLRMVTSFLTQIDKKYRSIIDDKGKVYIDYAVDGAKRMRQIILDLLEFSKVGTIEEKQENIDINDLVDEIKILFRKQISEKRAVINCDGLPRVLGHKSPLRQVFQNLVSNALKYSTNDKPVTIRITAEQLKDQWLIAISDNGIGIEAEYFDRIFIIFQRLHNKDEFSGTGMGLALTKKIIENQGGKIWLKSEAGKGSTFYFTIQK
ncbi:MAG TPA: PAS domain S-box protein, partial [Ferruginibacter sp.]|nr:PAS domain S-box protein [Ferruginibacter sp.]